MAEDLKRVLLLEGLELAEATLLELEALGYYSDFTIAGDENHVEIELLNLAIVPKVNIDNPLIVGAIAGIMDSSFGAEYEVKIVEARKESESSYYAKVECRPLESLYEQEESERGARARRGFLRRR